LQCEDKRSKNETENITTAWPQHLTLNWFGPASQQLTSILAYT